MSDPRGMYAHSNMSCPNVGCISHCGIKQLLSLFLFGYKMELNRLCVLCWISEHTCHIQLKPNHVNL